MNFNCSVKIDILYVASCLLIMFKLIKNHFNTQQLIDYFINQNREPYTHCHDTHLLTA